MLREQWNLGIVHQSIEDIARRGIVGKVTWLPAPNSWEMLADPACLTLADGSRLIMAERLNYWVGRGEIWAARIPSKGDPARAEFRPWMTSKVHLSYPFPFSDEYGNVYLTVESWESRGCYLWQQHRGEWKPMGSILDRPTVDATILRWSGRWWLFCTFQNEGENECLHLFSATELPGPWTPHPNNSVKRDAGSSRPAGGLFVVDGKLIRPAQDCSRTYGGALVLHEVTRLDPEGFAETPIRRLEPMGDYADGLHTLCRAGDVTFIDGKRWVSHPADVLRRMVVGTQTRLRRRGARAEFEFCPEDWTSGQELDWIMKTTEPPRT